MRHRKSPAPLRRRTLVFALLAASLVPTAASIAAEEKDAGLSAGWTIERNHLGLQRLTTPGINRDWIELQDMKKLDAGQPLTRFAIAHTHKIAPTHFGSWDQPAPGIMRWRLVLSSPDAVSINLGFSRFTLPEGAELTLLDGSGKAQFRSFTAADNDDHGQLWTPIVRGDEVTLVLTVPAKAVDAVQLEIGKVNHGYRGLGEIPWFAKSGACNVDVICPEGDDWREQIRSVAALTRFGVDQCSGALVNNAEGDLRGYFLTAAHCDFNNNTDAAGMVAYWDFENSTCRTPGGGPSGGAGDGTLTEFNTGAIFRASRAASDFTLVEFDDPIDPDTTPYWAGIDARDQATTSAVAIHHPSVDEKRISFEDDPTTITSYLGEPVPGDGTHIRVTDWDLGTTKGGSSGSPLFSPDKHIVGQLHGGFASCSSQTSDWYGRVAVSWETGLTDATQLKAWLDPNDTGVLIIDGRNEIEAGFNIDLDPVALEVCAIDPGTEADISVAVTQEDVGFLDPVTLSVTDLPANATSGFLANPVVPGNATTLTLGALEQVAAGTYVIGVEGTDGVDTVAKAISLNLYTATPAAATLTSPGNGSTGASTSPMLSWSAVAQAQGYRVQVDNNSDFSSPEFDQVVTDTSVVVPGLSTDTEYSWRVTAENACDAGALSAVFTFETGTQYCDIAGAAIPDNAPNAPLVRTIVVPESAEITGLQLGLDVTHTWMGDIIATLSKDGVSRIVFDRPGVVTTGAGCNGDDASIVLDDDGTLVAETNCTSATPSSTPIQAYIDGELYQPNESLAGFIGEDLAGTWTLTVSDNAGQDTGTLDSWCLLPATQPIVNDPPVAGPLADVGVNTGEALNYDAGAAFSDPEGDTLAFTADGLPAWAAIDPATGVITGTPGVADAGVFEVTVTASEVGTPDTFSADAAFTLTVTEVNLPPELDSPIPDTDASAGVPFTFDAGAYFSDPNGDALAFVALGLPAWASIDPATGIITGNPTPADAGGGVFVTVRATENHPDARTAQDGFLLEVVDDNVAPVATSLEDVGVEVGADLAFDAAAAFSDPDGDTLAFSATGLPAWAAINPVTGVITGTPGAADVGDYFVTVTTTEDTPDAFTAEASFTLTVIEGGLPPIALFADGFED